MSKNPIESGETRISSDPRTNFIAERHPRQGGSLGRPKRPELVKAGVRFATKGLLAGSALLGSAGVAADNTPEFTVLNTPSVNEPLNVLAYPNNGTTDKMLVEVNEDLFRIDPMPRNRGRIRLLTTKPTRDYRCDQQGVCDWDQVRADVADFQRRTGIIIHIPFVVIKSETKHYGNGQSSLPFPVPGKPIDNSHIMTVVRPENVPDAARLQRSSDILHELLHSVVGTQHGGGDLMDHNISGPEGLRLNDTHARELSGVLDLGPRRYNLPRSSAVINNPGVRVVLEGGNPIYLLSDMTATALIITPRGTNQVTNTVLPANNDGDSPLNQTIGEEKTIREWQDKGKTIERPDVVKGPTLFLPRMTYTWTIKQPPIETWPGVFSPVPDIVMRFRTPDINEILTPVTQDGMTTTSETPVLQWAGDSRIWYREVQVSGDPNFEMDPAKAVSFVQWNLIHGGQTRPINSYAVPQSLDAGTYFWRVRQRIQGDGAPVAWGPTWKFTVVGVNKEILTPTRYLLNPFGLPILGETMFAKPVLDFGFVQDAKRDNQKYRQAKDENRVAKEEYERKQSFANHAQAIVDAASGRDSTIRVGDYIVNIPAAR